MAISRQQRRKEMRDFAKAIRRAKAAGIIKPPTKRKPLLQTVKEFLTGTKSDSLRPKETT